MEKRGHVGIGSKVVYRSVDEGCEIRLRTWRVKLSLGSASDVSGNENDMEEKRLNRPGTDLYGAQIDGDKKPPCVEV